MADVQSPFNPGYERKHEETYDYRGADAPNPQRYTGKESSMAGASAANLLVGAVGVKDDLYKERVREEITADVDAVRDPWIGAGPSASLEGNNPAAHSGNVPVDLRKQLETLDKRTQQYQARAISDRYYWAQMENIARATRSRYPGYREHIDNVISNLTGGTPANVLQRSLQEEANSLDRDAKKAEDERQGLIRWAAQNGVYKPSFDGMTTGQLYQEIGEKTSFKYKVDLEKSLLELEKTKTAAVASRANAVAGQEIQGVIYDKLQDDIERFQKFKTEAIADGSIKDPKKQAEIAASGAALGSMLIAETQKILSHPAYTAMTDADKQARMETSKKFASILTAQLQAGEWDAVSQVANTLKLTKDVRAQGILDSDELITQQVAITDLLGPDFGNLHLKTINPNTGKPIFDDITNSLDPKKKEISSIDQGLIQKHANKIALKEGGSMTATFDQVNNSKADNPAAVRQGIFNYAVTMLKNKDAPISVRANQAVQLFSEENKDFLTHFPQKRVEVFNQMNSPEMAQAMLELKNSGREDLYQNWVNWREYTAVAVMFKTDFQTAAAIPANDQTMYLSVDQTTGKLVPQERNHGVNWIDRKYNEASSWIMGSMPAIQNVNSVIDALTPGWKAEGKNVSEQAQRLYTLAMIPFNASKGDTLLMSIRNAIGTNEEGRRLDEQKELVDRESLKKNLGLRKADGSYRLEGDDPSIEGMMSIKAGYTPGDRESTNVEDRRTNSSEMMKKYGDLPNTFTIDGATYTIDPNLIPPEQKDAYRALWWASQEGGRRDKE